MTVNKPSTTESEYFAREEAEKLKRLSAAQAASLAQKDKDELKKLHFMKCPKCGLNLQSIVFKGHTLDKCFTCNGVFLDGPEFDSIAGSEGGLFQSITELFK